LPAIEGAGDFDCERLDGPADRGDRQGKFQGDPKEAELFASGRAELHGGRAETIADFVVGTNDQKQEKAKRLFAARYTRRSMRSATR
jgi:hypothetical protein